MVKRQPRVQDESMNYICILGYIVFFHYFDEPFYALVSTKEWFCFTYLSLP